MKNSEPIKQSVSNNSSQDVDSQKSKLYFVLLSIVAIMVTSYVIYGTLGKYFVKKTGLTVIPTTSLEPSINQVKGTLEKQNKIIFPAIVQQQTADQSTLKDVLPFILNGAKGLKINNLKYSDGHTGLSVSYTLNSSLSDILLTVRHNALSWQTIFSARTDLGAILNYQNSVMQLKFFTSLTDANTGTFDVLIQTISQQK